MLDERWYLKAPWIVASPVRPSRFVPQREEHAIYNVETDLGALGAFGGLIEKPDLETLLFSDLQTQTGFHEPGRLGSGRTGFYRGAYLKGWGGRRSQRTGGATTIGFTRPATSARAGPRAS